MKTLPYFALWACLCLPIRAATTPSVISAAAGSGATAQGDSFAPVFSPDGRFVVFVSSAKNLATNEAPSPWLDVYLRDLESDRTELVSVNVSGTGGGNGNSFHPSVSSNGLFVAFQSEASNLVANDTNHYTDVFVRDMTSGVTTLVSVSTNGIENANSGSSSPQISADGARIVFSTTAPNVFPNGSNPLGIDIGVYDRIARSNQLVTVNATGTGSGMGRYGRALALGFTMSEEGRYVVFQSDATNLVAGVSTPNGGVFVRDLASSTTYFASAGVADPNAAYASPEPTIGTNGHAFFAVRDNTGYTLITYDSHSGITRPLASNVLCCAALKASADGRFIAVSFTNGIAVIDSEAGPDQIVPTPDLKSWRSLVISSDGQRLAFIGATNVNGTASVFMYDRATATRQVVSVTTNGEPAGIPALSDVVISGDARRVGFESRASNLVAADFNNANDIFVRDLSNNTTHVVSAAAVRSSSPALRSFLGGRSVSDLGRVISFTSLDHSLVPNDENAWCSAFVKDRLSGTNRLLSTIASRALGTNRLAFNPTISTNGRYVAWMEQPTLPLQYPAGATNIFWLDLETGAERAVTCNPVIYNLGPPPCLSGDGRWLLFTAPMPGSAYSQVFRRDMFAASSTNELLSYKAIGGGPGNGDSYGPAITPDGKWVVFASRAMDVVTNISQVLSTPHTVARNIATGEARWINWMAFKPFYDLATNFVVSGNSRFAFVLVPSPTQQIYRQDLKNGNASASLVCTGAFSLSVSHDGDVVAYLAQDSNVYVRDLRTGETNLISTNVLGCCPVGGSGRSSAPLISGDGRYVIFASAATNLVPDDTNNASDIFVHDRTTRATMLVSRTASGAPGNASSSSPVLAADGRTVVFSSSASDLVANDFNNARDIFVVRLGGEDSDLDGMDDDWELAYFNTLSRDGTGDFDGDGASDRQEFLAGTDPTNARSIFRALTVAPAAGNSRLVLWQSQAGRRYRVEYKNEADEEFWQELGTVSASDSTASLNDPAAAPHRIYRIVLVP